MRIKIEFQEDIPLQIAAYRKCWYLLEPNIHTVAELIRDIEDRFLLTTIKNICHVYIDDFIVLPEQKCSILKENDIIHVKSDCRNAQYKTSRSPNTSTPSSVTNPSKRRRLLRNYDKSPEHKNISFSSTNGYSSDTSERKSDQAESNNITKKRKRAHNVVISKSPSNNTVKRRIENKKSVDGRKSSNDSPVAVQTKDIAKKTNISLSNKAESSTDDSDSDSSGDNSNLKQVIVRPKNSAISSNLKGVSISKPIITQSSSDDSDSSDSSTSSDSSSSSDSNSNQNHNKPVGRPTSTAVPKKISKISVFKPTKLTSASEDSDSDSDSSDDSSDSSDDSSDSSDDNTRVNNKTYKAALIPTKNMNPTSSVSKQITTSISSLTTKKVLSSSSSSSDSSSSDSSDSSTSSSSSSSSSSADDKSSKTPAASSLNKQLPGKVPPAIPVSKNNSVGKTTKSNPVSITNNNSSNKSSGNIASTNRIDNVGGGRGGRSGEAQGRGRGRGDEGGRGRGRSGGGPSQPPVRATPPRPGAAWQKHCPPPTATATASTGLPPAGVAVAPGSGGGSGNVAGGLTSLRPPLPPPRPPLTPRTPVTAAPTPTPTAAIFPQSTATHNYSNVYSQLTVNNNKGNQEVEEIDMGNEQIEKDFRKKPYSILASVHSKAAISEIEQRYQTFPLVNDVNTVRLGDVIAYKTVTLCEDSWNPVVSDFKEGKVVEISQDGDALVLQGSVGSFAKEKDREEDQAVRNSYDSTVTSVTVSKYDLSDVRIIQRIVNSNHTTHTNSSNSNGSGSKNANNGPPPPVTSSSASIATSEKESPLAIPVGEGAVNTSMSGSGGEGDAVTVGDQEYMFLEHMLEDLLAKKQELGIN